MQALFKEAWEKLPKGGSSGLLEMKKIHKGKRPEDQEMVSQLLSAASDLHQIPEAVKKWGAIIYIKDFTDHEMLQINHLLKLLSATEIQVWLRFDECDNINSSNMTPIFQYIPYAADADFRNNSFENDTLVKITDTFTDTMRLYTLKLHMCNLTDDLLQDCSHKLAYIRRLGMAGNPRLTENTYKSIFDEAEKRRDRRLQRVNSIYLTHDLIIKKINEIKSEYPKLKYNISLDPYSVGDRNLELINNWMQ